MEPRNAAAVFFPDAGGVDHGLIVTCNLCCEPGLQVSVERAESVDVWADIEYLG